MCLSHRACYSVRYTCPKDPVTRSVRHPRLGLTSCCIDTGGSNYIDVDARVSQAYYNRVPGSIPSSNGAGGTTYSFPCNATLPDLTLNIGNGTAVYRAKLLTFNDPDSKNSKPLFPNYSLIILCSRFPQFLR